jgi:NADH-quinone oxidoreductase subunit B
MTGLEEKLPGGILLVTVEKVADTRGRASVWPVYFGLACRAMALMNADGLRHDLAGFGMEKAPLAAAGRTDDRRGTGQPEDGPVLRQIYDQMPDPNGSFRWVYAPQRRHVRQLLGHRARG